MANSQNNPREPADETNPGNADGEAVPPSAPGEKSANTPKDAAAATQIGEDDPNLQATFVAPQEAVATDIGAERTRTGGQSGPKSASVGTRVRGEGASVIGTMIGDYRIDEELGRGGMGVVYKAYHVKLRRHVALKMILAGNHADPSALDRFLTEARAVAHLQHPNIVQIFDIGEVGGLPYFSLEYVEGEDLKQRLGGDPMEPRPAAEMVEILARATQYAHENNVLHRDLKPANVLLAPDGQPKITDFGLAKQLEESEEDSGENTSTGTILGSPAYMPPEQAAGKTHSVGPRADQYSLGAVLYQMLTGRPPFAAANRLDTLMMVIRTEPVPPRQLQPHVPIDLETICLKALSKDQSQRYTSCTQFADDLRHFLRGEPILARPITRPEQFLRWCRRNPRIAIPSAAAIMLLCAVTVISTWSYWKVSEQGKVIKKERDAAQEQTRLAVTRAGIARSQANLALKNMQFVLTDIIERLKNSPQTEELRKSLMTTLAGNFKDLKVDYTEDDIEGQAYPTLMAMRKQLANTLADLGETQAALDQLELIREMAVDRLRIRGRNDAARMNLAKTLFMIARLRFQLSGDLQESLKTKHEILALVNEIIEQPGGGAGAKSTWVDVRETRGTVLQGIGVDHLTNGNVPTAADYFRQALEVNGEVLKHIRSEPGFADKTAGQKDQATYMKQLSYDRSALALGYMLLRLGESEQAIDYYEEALAGRREITDRYPLPKMVPLHAELAAFSGNYGNAFLWLDDPQKAEPLLEESQEISERVFGLAKSVKARRDLAKALYRTGTLRDLQGDTKRAAADFRRCAELRQELADNDDTEQNRTELMLALGRCGRMQPAEELAAQLDQAEGTSGERHLQRARCYAQLSRHAATDEKKAELVTAALDALAKAHSEGFQDPFRVQAEQDLDPLHEHERYRKIVSEFENKASR